MLNTCLSVEYSSLGLHELWKLLLSYVQIFSKAVILIHISVRTVSVMPKAFYSSVGINGIFFFLFNIILPD